MSLDRRASRELERPIESVDDLVGYFRAGEKPADRWLVGLEHEKLAVLESGAALPFDGDVGIESVLQRFARADGWKPLEEEGRVIALERGANHVSLEPGGQVELDGTPLRTVHEVRDEIERHIQSLRRVSDPLGIRWLGVGLHPFASLDQVPRVPRERYRLMRSIMASRGELALEMMHCTAAVQVSLDYEHEADMVAKMRAALAATPIAAALFANSSLSDGRPNGFVSRRLHVWERTDADRTGILPFVSEPDFGYARYAEYALDVPAFFFVREGCYRSLGGKTFRRFVGEGHEGERATIADFELHLTTLFPHVRLKRILELRVTDAVPPNLLAAIPAFWKGLLYDADAREAAVALGRRWDAAEKRALLAEVARHGLRAKGPDGALLPVARDLLAIAREGLRRTPCFDASGRDESAFLEPLEARIAEGRSLGEAIAERWRGEWGHAAERLIEHVRY